jgi:integrase
MQSPGTVPQLDPDASTDLTVAELGSIFLNWATDYYTKNGQPTSEIQNVKRAIRCLRECFAPLPAREFSPLKLKTCRDRLIADGLCRSNVNRYQGIIVRVFGHAVENELVPAETWHALRAVKRLVKGRSAARETEPVGPVDDATIEATLPHLGEPYKTMVRVQLLLGCRPGELVTLKPADIDRSGPVWIYRPRVHKTEHKGKSRIIVIGPRAQLLLRPIMPPFPDQWVFRNTRGLRVSVRYYNWLVKQAATKAGVDTWTVNQLRHAAATKIRERASLDAAQVILGHSSLQTTQVYAEKNLEAALRIAAEVG